MSPSPSSLSSSSTPDTCPGDHPSRGEVDAAAVIPLLEALVRRVRRLEAELDVVGSAFRRRGG